MYTATINVRFYETDMMGIAHHSNHFRWFEMARIEFLRHIGVTLWDMMDEDIVFPIMNVSCNYKEPARFDDTINIETYLVKMTRAQMVFKYRMRRASMVLYWRRVRLRMPLCLNRLGNRTIRGSLLSTYSKCC